MNASMPAKLLAEFIGTLTLIAVGVGSIYATATSETLTATHADLLVVALAHGLAIALMVTALGHVSGGHFNPAITLAMVVTKGTQIKDAVGYWVAQLAGGAAGMLLIKWMWDGVNGATDMAGVPVLGDGVSTGQALLAEGLMTFFLVWVVYAVAVDADGAWSKLAGLPIGLTITMGIFMGGTLTGGAMNPARWFGPALIAGEWGDGWIYIVGPAVGAIIAGLLYINVIKPRTAG
jgi:MIP family channel proteins